MAASTQTHNGAPEKLNAATISTRLFNLTRSHDSRYDCIYLLLDRHTEHPLKESIDALPDAYSVTLPLLDALFKDNPDQSPLLLCLQNQQPQHMELLEQSIALALEQTSQSNSLRSVCAWIISDAEPPRLQNSLTQKLLAYWPGNQGIYLRYFDPRVMPRLMHILPPQQQTQLLGPVVTWCQLGRDGQWLSHSPARDTAHIAQSSAHLRLGPQLAQAVDRIEMINLTAAALARQGHAVPHSQDADIDAVLLAAQTLGITSADDTVAYAWRATLHKSLFTAHPALVELIKQSAASGVRLDTLLEDDLILQAA